MNISAYLEKCCVCLRALYLGARRTRSTVGVQLPIWLRWDGDPLTPSTLYGHATHVLPIHILSLNLRSLYLSHHHITTLTCQLLDTQHPVNHRSHQGETHPVNQSHIWAKHTQSTMKVIAGQNTPSQPWKSYVGKTHPVNHGSYIWTKHT